MPFTVSHAAAVLPLATGRPGRVLVPAALVIGSMVPDLPYFIPPYRGGSWSHAASGPVTIDLIMGLVVLVVWQLLLYRPLVDFAPRWVGERLPEPRPIRRVGWLWAAVSVVIGAGTHVLLDSFTHPDRWGTIRLAALNAYAGPLPVYEWLQFALGVLGLIILAGWATSRLRAAQPRPLVSMISTGQRRLAWLLTATVFLGAMAVNAILGLLQGLRLEYVAFQAVTGAMSLAAATGIVLCLIWQLAARTSVARPSERPADRVEHGPG